MADAIDEIEAKLKAVELDDRLNVDGLQDMDEVCIKLKAMELVISPGYKTRICIPCPENVDNLVEFITNSICQHRMYKNWAFPLFHDHVVEGGARYLNMTWYYQFKTMWSMMSNEMRHAALQKEQQLDKAQQDL
jgi:hypothetical protein